MKITFLDIDGVCNSYEWYVKKEKPIIGEYFDEDIDPEVIDRINRLCEESDSKIVISSSWRIDSYYKQRLEKAGLKNIIDKTPITAFDSHYFTRGEEIQMWLEYHPEVTNYVIIDDYEDFMKEQLPHFVKINPYKGFTEGDYNKALKILSGWESGYPSLCKSD